MTISEKLIGDDEERAVSPVIGVILMVAITVILAAVIAAFVLDLGSGISEEAQAGVSFDQEGSGNSAEIKVTYASQGNADRIVVRGDVGTSPPSSGEITGVGQTLTLECNTADHLENENGEGTINAVAVIDGGSETQVGSFDYDCTP
ncbi:type IV pilin [Natrialbaceae archaeon A-chndr2]